MIEITVCTDSFKDSFSSLEINGLITEKLGQLDPNIRLNNKPLADGGEGTLESIQAYLDLETIICHCKDPLGRFTEATYLLDTADHQAYIEMAQASGLQLLTEDERSASMTSTMGTGEIILNALNRNAKRINLFVGGSATNDGGAGMLQALGFSFFAGKDEINFVRGFDLARITAIFPPANDILDGIDVVVYCDVKNPLLGLTGATMTYGFQKAASKEDLERLEAGMQNYADLLDQVSKKDLRQTPGAGAAGGICYAALAGLNASVASGIEKLIEISQIQKELARSEWLITGEGKIDHQTIHGKLIKGVCDYAKLSDVRILALSAVAEILPDEVRSIGIEKLFTLYNKPPAQIDRSDSLLRLDETLNKVLSYIREQHYQEQHNNS